MTSAEVVRCAPRDSSRVIRHGRSDSADGEHVCQGNKSDSTSPKALYVQQPGNDGTKLRGKCLNLVRLWWVSIDRVPLVAFWDIPVAVASPRPIRVLDHLLHRLCERSNRTQAILLLGTALDRGQRYDTIVDDDADLRVGESGAGENYKHSISTMKQGETRKFNARWKCTFVENGAKWETLNQGLAGMWSAGSGPPEAKFVRLSAVKTKQKLADSPYATLESRLTVENHNFVCGIDIEALTQRERRWVVIQRSVGR